MSIDLHPVLAGLLSLALAIVTAAIPILVRAALARMNLANQADLADRITAAADTGAGLAYGALVKAGQGVANPVVKNEALAIGAQYVLTQVAGPLAALGKDPSSVTAMVDGKLGRLLALDPAVSVRPTVAPMPLRATIQSNTGDRS